MVFVLNAAFGDGRDDIDTSSYYETCKLVASVFKLKAVFMEGSDGVNNVSITSGGCRMMALLMTADGYLHLICVLASISILVVLSCLQRRHSLCPDRCWARPSLPVPMDFLVTPLYRLPYILVFTLLAADLLSTIIFSSSLTQNVNVYVNIIYKIVILPFFIVLFLGLKYFPLLACVQASSQHLGHCLGLAYSLLWFIVTLVNTGFKYYWRVCYYSQGSNSLSPAQVTVYVFQYVPILLISLAVICWYLFHVITCHVAPGPKEQRGVRGYQLLRVKKLLSRSNSTPVVHGQTIALLIKIGDYFIPYSKYVRLPVPFLCVVVAMAAFLYQLSFIVVLEGIDILKTLSVQYNQIKSHLNISGPVDDILSGLLKGVSVLFVISPFVSLGLCAFLLLHMIGSISKLVKATARQGFTEKLPVMVARVPGAWTYLGVQMGLFLCGTIGSKKMWIGKKNKIQIVNTSAWVIFSQVVFLMGLAAMAMYYGLKYSTSYFINLLLFLIVPVLWSNGMFYLQYLICKFIFYEDSSGKFISITNQHLFNWFAYLLFLYNGFGGFAKAIVRVVITAFISLLLLFRLDTIILAHGFEFFDFGHKAFLGFFYLDYCYNNAVVHTFIHLLRKEPTKPEKCSGLFYSDPFPLLESRKKHARNRWLVAYTLLRNLSVRKLTASNLAAEKIVKLQPAIEMWG